MFDEDKFDAKFLEDWDDEDLDEENDEDL